MLLITTATRLERESNQLNDLELSFSVHIVHGSFIPLAGAPGGASVRPTVGLSVERGGCKKK
jgi:hypothetical protein